MAVLHLSSNKIWGGVERYILDLAISQRNAGEKVIIYSRGFSATDTPFIDNGLEVRHIRLKGVADWSSPIALARDIRAIEDNDIIIHAHNFKNAITAIRAKRLAGKSKNVKVVVTLHFRKVAHTSLYWKHIYSRIDKIIFVSDIIKQIFLSSKPGIKPEKMCVVHNSVHAPQPFITEASRTGVPTLVFTGRICPDKGVGTFLDALALIDKNIQFSCRIIGTGDEEYVNSLKDKCKLSGLEEKVEWTGHVSDVFSHITDAYAGIAPSICVEAFGLTILEFMSQGIPVIASSNGAQPEIIDSGKEGILVHPDSPEELADAITRILANPQLREKMGIAARKRFLQQFSYDGFFKAIQEAYR